MRQMKEKNAQHYSGRTSGKTQIVERGVRVKGKPHCYKDSREVWQKYELNISRDENYFSEKGWAAALRM